MKMRMHRIFWKDLENYASHVCILLGHIDVGVNIDCDGHVSINEWCFISVKYI